MLRAKRENELRLAEKMLKNAEFICNDLQEKNKLHLDNVNMKSLKVEKLESKVEDGAAM